MVTFSHHAVNFGAKALLIHHIFGVKTLPIWCQIDTKKKWFGAKTRYFLVRKRDILFFMIWCQNVKTWCEFETYAEGGGDVP